MNFPSALAQALELAKSEVVEWVVESMLTVSTTCTLQARNVLEYLVRVIEAVLSDQPPPALIPPPARSRQAIQSTLTG